MQRRSSTRACLAVLALVALAGEAAHAVFQVGGARLDGFFGDWVYTALEVTGAALCTWRAAAVRRERAAWAAMAIGLWAWTAGDLLWTVWLNDVANPPFPSVADGCYYASYAGQYACLALLLRARVRPLRADLCLDGLIAGLGAAALAAAVVFEPIRRATHGSAAVVAFTLAYPVMDLMLLCMVAVAFGVLSWRPGRAWA